MVTKLPLMANRPELVEAYFNMSLKNLGLDYVDLYLIHAPIGVERDPVTNSIRFYDGGKVKFETDTDLVGLWKQMEKIADSGKAKSIGVANFNSKQIKRVSSAARIPIAVNQIECYAYFMQKKLRETLKRLNIKVCPIIAIS